MAPNPPYHPPKGEECQTSVEHGLPLWAEPTVGYSGLCNCAHLRK